MKATEKELTLIEIVYKQKGCKLFEDDMSHGFGVVLDRLFRLCGLNHWALWTKRIAPPTNTCLKYLA